jgi:hypothetical protein
MPKSPRLPLDPISPVPFSLTKQERFILTILSLIIVLGVVGLAVL